MATVISISNSAQITKVLNALFLEKIIPQASGGTQGALTIDVGRTIATHTAGSTEFVQVQKDVATGEGVLVLMLVDGGTVWYENVGSKDLGALYWTSKDSVGVGILSGVVSAGSGFIEAATITVTKGALTYTGTSDATTGAYSIPGIAADTGYAVTCSKAGYASATASVNITEDTTTTQNLTLVEYGSVAGTCKDDAGVDLDGATVTITKGAFSTSVTSAAGAYEILSVPVAAGYTLTVAKATYVTGSYTVAITEATETAQNVVASRYGSISGTVTDETGNVEGAVVEFYADGTVTPVVYTATTVANGTYAVANVAPGIYDGKITKANHVDLTISNQTVVAATDKVIDGVLPEYANYSGKCTAAAGGADLADVVVALYAIYPGTPAYTATSAADGTYAITNIVPATYQLRVSKATFVTQFTADLATLIADADIVNANFAMVAV